MKRVQSVKSLSLISSKPMGLSVFGMGGAISFVEMILRRVNPIFLTIKNDVVRFFLYQDLKDSIVYNYYQNSIFRFYHSQMQFEKEKYFSFPSVLGGNTYENHNSTSIFNLHRGSKILSSIFIPPQRGWNESKKPFDFISNKIFTFSHSKTEFENEENFNTYGGSKKNSSSRVELLSSPFNRYKPFSMSIDTEPFDHREFNQAKRELEVQDISNSLYNRHLAKLGNENFSFVFSGLKPPIPNEFYKKSNDVLKNKSHSNNKYHKNFISKSISNDKREFVNETKELNYTKIDKTDVEIIYKKENIKRESIKKEEQTNHLYSNLESKESNTINRLFIIKDGMEVVNSNEEKIENFINNIEQRVIQRVSSDVMAKVEAKWSREIMRRGGDYGRW